MSKKHKKACATLNYIEFLLILPSAVTGFISICEFVSLFGISRGIMSSAIGLEICAITGRIKKYELIVKNKKQGW